MREPGNEGGHGWMENELLLMLPVSSLHKIDATQGKGKGLNNMASLSLPTGIVRTRLETTSDFRKDSITWFSIKSSFSFPSHRIVALTRKNPKSNYMSYSKRRRRKWIMPS